MLYDFDYSYLLHDLFNLFKCDFSLSYHVLSRNERMLRFCVHSDLDTIDIQIFDSISTGILLSSPLIFFGPTWVLCVYVPVINASNNNIYANNIISILKIRTGFFSKYFIHVLFNASHPFVKKVRRIKILKI